VRRISFVGERKYWKGFIMGFGTIGCRGDINRNEESKETVIAGRIILSKEFESIHVY
jgi:hypothetical protein